MSPNLRSEELAAIRQGREKYDPFTDETFDTNGPVWYLAHPIAPDEKHTFQDNMDDVVEKLKMCTEEGLNVIAPYHTLLLFQNDDKIEDRKRGMECNCALIKQIAGVILSGHRMSSGMEVEAWYAERVWNIVNVPDDIARESLRRLKKLAALG